MILVSQMKFDLGRLVITPGALETVSADDICHALDRHVCGDWGDVDEYDWTANELALNTGSRLLSIYHATAGTKFCVLTSADRSLTTVLLPEDY